MLKEFKEFALRGNVVDLAVAAIKAEKLDMSNGGGGMVWYSYTFPEVTLSVPEGELAPGFTKVKAALQYQRVP